MPVQTSLDVHQIIDLFRQPAGDGDLLVSAHRGLRWDGVPENSTEAVVKAAEFGLLCIEVDVRLTADGHPVVLHDKGLGRATNIAEHLGRADVYNPWTGKGYSPRVNSTPWSLVSQLKLKNELGEITYVVPEAWTDGSDEGVLDFESMLDLMEAESIEMVLFLDVKDKAALPAAYELVKGHRNAKGVPALEWCVWKLDTSFYRTPTELEADAWFADSLRTGSPLYIPVFEPDAPQTMDVVHAGKTWAAQSYCLAIEVSLRGPGGPLQDLVDWCVEHRVSVGYFASLGDIHPPDGREILMDTAGFDFEAARRRTGPLWYFEELNGTGPITYNSRTTKAIAPRGVDGRAELDEYRSMGYCWIIADLTNRSAHIFKAQAKHQQPQALQWRDERLERVMGC